MVHGSLAVPGRFDADEVSFTDQEVAQSNLDYLALGHWHSFREGRAGKTTWAYSGAPEPVALDQDGAGQVALVSLDERDGKRRVVVEPRPVGRTSFRRMEVDAATVGSQAELDRRLRELANPDLVLDVRLVGVRPSQLDLNVDELDGSSRANSCACGCATRRSRRSTSAFAAGRHDPGRVHARLPGAHRRSRDARRHGARGRAARGAAPGHAAARRPAAGDAGMNITRLRLTDFRRHAELDVELKPGLNIVRGPNEAGKSTIQRAIELALFRRPTFASAELDDLRPWQRPDADPTIELEFDHEGQHGVMRKVFAGQRGTVEFTWEGDTLTDPTAVEAEIARLTGLPSEKFFRATASVHHQELAGLTQDESTLRDRLQQSMSGADRGTHAARRKLEDAIRRYRTEGAKNPGYLKVMRADVERLREQVRTGEAALTQLEADRRELAAARDGAHALDAQLAEQREDAAKAERAADADLASATDAAKRYALYKRAAELREEIGKLEAAHPSAVALPVLRKTVEHLRKLEFKLSEMRAELAAEPDLSGYDVSIPNPRWRPWVVDRACCWFSRGGRRRGRRVLRHRRRTGVGAGRSALGRDRRCWRSNAAAPAPDDIRLQNELREAEIARRLAGRTDLAERVHEAEQERVEALGSLHLPDLATAETTLAAETEHVSQIGTRRAEYRGLMGDDPADEDVAELRDKAAAEADECRHSLAGMGEIGRRAGALPERLPAGDHPPHARARGRVQAEAQAEARVNANEVDAEEVAADAEALEHGRGVARRRRSGGCASTRTCSRRSTPPSAAR